MRWYDWYDDVPVNWPILGAYRDDSGIWRFEVCAKDTDGKIRNMIGDEVFPTSCCVICPPIKMATATLQNLEPPALEKKR